MMAYRVSSSAAPKAYQRLYTNLKGVDFSSIPSRVVTSRSPEAKNVYKNYNSELGQAIETRPGIRLLGNLNKIAYDINCITNGNFGDGTSGWIGNNLIVSENICSVIGDETRTDPRIYQTAADTISIGSKMYLRAMVRVTNADCTQIVLRSDGGGAYNVLHTLEEPTINTWYTISAVRQKTANDVIYPRVSHVYADIAAANGKVMEVRDIILANLTALFGEGNEPTAGEMDSWINAALARTTNKVYGLHVLDNGKALIHMESDLYIWKSFPNEINSTEDIQKINIVMNKEFSQSFKYTVGEKIKLYLLDGQNYLVYDGEEVSEVAGTIPLTRMNALPSGSGGVAYQGVNYLSDYRKNSFIGDSSSLNYCLDTQPTDATGLEVYINGIKKESGVSLNGSVVTLNSPAGAPATPGQDNVVIVFRKETDGYANYIKGCRLCKTFDNRVFVSGNDACKGVLFHSELDDPAYYADESWYDDGADNVAVKAIIASSDKLICIKDNGGEGVKVYFHTSSLDSTLGRIYPKTESEIHLGAAAGGTNFRDAVVYLSAQGLENIISDEYSVRLYHKSSLVDTKLMNEVNYAEAKMEVWNNYLCILINGKLYLADSRQVSEGEYEWYYWDNIGIAVDGTLENATVLRQHSSELYFATADGQVCVFAGTHDDSLVEGTKTPVLIDSYWTTPMDTFNSLTHLKTTNKRGGVAQIKRIPNSVFKIDVKTDKEDWNNILSSTTKGFTFLDFLYFLREVEGYEKISFGTGVRGFLVFKVKKRKIKQFSMKFYSDETDKPFGLYEATIEFAIGNYVKS